METLHIAMRAAILLVYGIMVFDFQVVAVGSFEVVF